MSEGIEQFRTRVQFQDCAPSTCMEPGLPEQATTFEVTAITAGTGNGWQFSAEVLRQSLDLWEGVEVFIDHQSPNTARSLRDLAGVVYAARFAESA
jgi:hypothetical protein